jgi:DNA-binding CsgD family transcriptional regulator
MTEELDDGRKVKLMHSPKFPSDLNVENIFAPLTEYGLDDLVYVPFALSSRHGDQGQNAVRPGVLCHLIPIHETNRFSFGQLSLQPEVLRALKISVWAEKAIDPSWFTGWLQGIRAKYAKYFFKKVSKNISNTLISVLILMYRFHIEMIQSKMTRRDETRGTKFQINETHRDIYHQLSYVVHGFKTELLRDTILQFATRLRITFQNSNFWDIFGHWLWTNLLIETWRDNKELGLCLGETISPQVWDKIFKTYIDKDELYSKRIDFLLDVRAILLSRELCGIIRMIDLMTPQGLGRLLGLEISEAGDLIALITTELGDEKRLKAAERILGRLGQVIARQRWQLVVPALMELATIHQRDPRTELQHLSLSGLFEASETVEAYTPAQWREAHHELKTRLNECLTIDLLGPGWHSRRPPVSFPSSRGISPISQIEARLTVEQMFAKTTLTLREAEIVAAIAQGKKAEEIAQELDIMPSTVRGIWRNARIKLQQAV